MEDIDNLKATELTLGLPGSEVPPKPKCNKRPMLSVGDDDVSERVAKAQAVGWPPVRAFRVNSFRAKKMELVDDNGGNNNGVYVKVSMDGAPYLRKVDLKMYKGYKELRKALEDMFKCFSLGGSEGYDEYGFAITYEDKEGDWMLVGDVPFEMFISSCKKLRIMKGTEAKGLTSSD